MTTRLSLYRRFERWFFRVLPKWAINLIAAVIATFIVWTPLALAAVFITFDWSYFWTWWTRMWLAIWFSVFVIIFKD